VSGPERDQPRAPGGGKGGLTGGQSLTGGASTAKGNRKPPVGASPKGAGVTRTPRPMPGGAEVLRAQRRAAREGIPAQPVVADTRQGIGVIRSAWAGTVIFAVTAAVGAVVPSARIGVVGVDLLLLLLGSLLYFWGWAVAAGRSRDSEISLWNLILLEDAAPRRVRLQLLGAVGVQVIVAAATCWITAALAFGWLVPLWGLAHCEYWGARYGTFLPRKVDPKADRGTRRR
jgi:hypothetical protein